MEINTHNGDDTEVKVNCKSDNGNFKNEIFKVNSIKFKDLEIQICLQSENGPCPLIAILNVLLLEGRVEIDKDNDYLTGDDMVHIVANYLMNLNENVEDIDVILQHFKELQTGLIVDVCFSSVTDFKDDSNLYIFKCLNIKLYHGWLMDPQTTPEYDRLRNYSYDQLTEELVTDSDNTASSETRSFLVEFIKSSQLTYHGLCQLNETMSEGELAVLFQNNHFSVIYKHGSVFSLCSDIGYCGDPGTVWQMLNSTSGDTDFVNDKFEPQDPFSGTYQCTVDSDWELAKKLALDDDYEMARALQDLDDGGQSGGHNSGFCTPSTKTTSATSTAARGTERQPARSSDGHIAPRDSKKDSSCVLL